MRTLKPEEIQCRVQIVKEKGFSVLLYKDARCDMNILDETYGEMGWSDEYHEIGGTLFCTVSVWDSEKKQWISKQDAGTESNMDAEKGRASDAFKRACFRWGIGRELYTAPFIWINAKEGEVYKRKDGKYGVKCDLSVFDITVENGVIKHLHIIDKNDQTRFTTKSVKKPILKPEHSKWIDAVHSIASGEFSIDDVLGKYSISKNHQSQMQAEAREFANSQ